MSDNVPRRLKRFYRTKNSNDNSYASGYNDYNDTDYSQGSGQLPTMDYEDIDDKNFEEIQKVEQQSLEEKLAMMEIEKFKKENKRMPNKEEQDKLANSLYEQFKENPSEEGSPSPRARRVGGRQRHLRKNREEPQQEDISSINEPVVSSQPSDIKSLLSDSAPTKGKKDEFDLGLDLGDDDDFSMGGELEELDDFSMEPKKKKKKI